jgi:hypothetical protein
MATRKTSWDVTPEDDRRLNTIKKELASNADVVAVRYAIKEEAARIDKRNAAKRKKAG